MAGNILRFYVGGNTARGFTSLLDSSLQQMERIMVLQGGTGIGKQLNLAELGKRLADEGCDIWFLGCASDANALDGLIIPGLKTGIIDGTTPRTLEATFKGIDVQYLNLGDACDSRQLDARKQEIERLNGGISQAYEQAYAGFAEALRIHDDWEAIFISQMDFKAAEQLTQQYIGSLYGAKRAAKKSRIDDRFLGAATPNGAVDAVPNLTEGLKRYFIKGRPGSGKSTLLKKLAAAAIDRGFDLEVYHCGFDPNSLDMIIVRELGFAIFDSTAPHEYDPERPTDEIVDMYDRCIAPGTDEAYAEPIAKCKSQYATAMKKAIGLLKEARVRLDELELIYLQSADSQQIARIKYELQQELLDRLAASRC